MNFTPPGSNQTYQWKKSNYLKKLAMEAKQALEELDLE